MAILLALFLFPFVCIINAITGFATEVGQLAQMLGAVVVVSPSFAALRTESPLTVPLLLAGQPASEHVFHAVWRECLRSGHCSRARPQAR